MARNGTRCDENKRHANPLTCTVRHRSLHGPIKIDISVCGSVAVSVSGHMQSCIIYFYFLDFYRSQVGIRILTNGIAPLTFPPDLNVLRKRLAKRKENKMVVILVVVVGHIGKSVGHGKGRKCLFRTRHFM